MDSPVSLPDTVVPVVRTMRGEFVLPFTFPLQSHQKGLTTMERHDLSRQAEITLMGSMSAAVTMRLLTGTCGTKGGSAPNTHSIETTLLVLVSLRLAIERQSAARPVYGEGESAGR